MTNDVTARMERLVLTLREMSQEIEPELHVVSQMARDEWRSLQGTWLSERHLREGTTGLTAEELEAIATKARRFKDIVHGLASSRLSDTQAGSLDPSSVPALVTER
jgi:hypothetical protein